MPLTPAQQRALAWLPADGSWSANPTQFIPSLRSLSMHHPQLVQAKNGNSGPRGGWQTRYRLVASHDVQSDGKTVWVNAVDGSCIGRFSRFGIDLHRTVSAQLAGEGACLDCTHGLPGRGDWEHFKAGLLEHYGIVLSDEHMPRFLQEHDHA